MDGQFQSAGVVENNKVSSAELGQSLVASEADSNRYWSFRCSSSAAPESKWLGGCSDQAMQSTRKAMVEDAGRGAVCLAAAGLVDSICQLFSSRIIAYGMFQLPRSVLQY